MYGVAIRLLAGATVTSTQLAARIQLTDTVTGRPLPYHMRPLHRLPKYPHNMAGSDLRRREPESPRQKPQTV